MARVSGQQDQDGNLAKFGEVVRQRRLDLKLSQEALADATGIDRSHMGKIERGERNVTLLNVIKIATALRCTAASLLEAARL